MQNLLEELIQLLSEDDRLVSEGKLLKNKVIELALNMDAGLIKVLLKNESIKRHFFVEVGGVFVFDKIKFQRFVSNKQFLPDSYTAFKNKIGLVNENGDYLSESREVVLAWPYKDCVLEGGQTKEDQKRDEIFWNETLAPDEIDRLRAPKVFTNFKRYDKDGEQDLSGKERIDFSKENLIIKGNNLLALHSLSKQFTRKVKLIYIDPPFNTSGAANTFTYNNTFNHSTWLTFIKNRIIIAEKYLSDDGIFAIAIDHSELFYLGALSDELFGKENRIGIISIETNPRGRSDSKFFATSNEYLLFYARNSEKAEIKDFDLTEEQAKAFNLVDDTSNYRLLPFRRSGSNSTPKERPNLYYPIYYEESNNYIGLDKTKNAIEIIPMDTDGIKRVWRHSKSSFIEAVKNNEIIIKKNNKQGYSVFLKDRTKDGRKPRTIWVNPLYDASSHGTNLLKDLFGDKLFSYPKSIHLIKDIFKICLNKNDIVLDFFAGSGTTAHAVLELNKEDGGNRKFIICEQMAYVETVTKERVKKVIEKNGGGSFIYCELMEHNEAYINRVRKAKTTKELLAIWEEMQEKAFISYKVDPKAINANISEFKSLSLDDQKRFLIDVLDKNQLYVNYSEIDDEDYGVTETDKKLNRRFYGEA